MIEPFTPAVERALHAARVLALKQQATEVLPLHLLHGLLQDMEAAPAACLLRKGVRRDELGAFVIGVQNTAETPALPLGAAVESVLRQARSWSRQWRGGEQVSSEQVLLWLLRQHVECRESLEALGLDFAALETEIVAETVGPPLQLDEPLFLEDVSEQTDAARILDANANRAREALRVLEDYCRFALDDAFLSRELKTLRHDLTAVIGQFPGYLLLAARDTVHDVGTALSTAAEVERTSTRDVLQAACKRLQESLRSLEEFGKLHDPRQAAELEQMRYRAYTVERMLLQGTRARERLAGVRLYLLLTGAHCWGPLENTVREAAAGGVQMFQLREKELSDRELLRRARDLRRWTRQTGTLFIVNDRPDIARLVEADGVHVGQDELPVREARRIVGADALVGVSTHNLEQLRQAVRDGADYVGIGPTFPSATKHFDEFPGLDFIRAASAETSLPAFAIGGITLANLPRVLDAGARRVAVSAALCGSETPQALARAMRQLLDAKASAERVG